MKPDSQHIKACHEGFEGHEEHEGFIGILFFVSIVGFVVEKILSQHSAVKQLMEVARL
ncbi:MAG: hypothetical protein H8E21_02725 [Gammaproteobacteria bacterium]|nr:hypothetical protein [Gammaproteobacteria bacterium]MBL6998959.1 hypothetical protein [Gammaproteobacteria bacterium]